MPHSTAPNNEFLWSHTRHETFSTCLRRYYYAFYAAWGGWFPTAPAPARLAYTLKRLQSRQTWLADRVVYAIAEILHAAPVPPDALPALAERVAERKLDLMRTEFLHSRNGAYRADPAHIVALFDHYYETPLSPDDWRDTVNRLPLAVTQFARSPLAAELTALPKNRFLSINRPVSVRLDGLHFRAHPHLVVLDPDASLHLYHWETDPATPLPALRQRLLIHALALSIARPDTPSPIRATAFHALLGTSLDFAFAPPDLADIRQFVLDSADEMLFPLAVPAANDPGD
ncbi:MAG: hypothetical protein IK066_08455, partial [Kiritimatiellae bacterium]|nr:hypothetical protein [Kiritimatiellia bacterium]